MSDLSCVSGQSLGGGYASSCQSLSGCLLMDEDEGGKIAAFCMTTLEEFGVATGFLEDVALDADSSDSHARE